MFAIKIVARLSYKSILHWFYDFSVSAFVLCLSPYIVHGSCRHNSLYDRYQLYAHKPHIMIFVIFKLEFQHDVEIHILIWLVLHVWPIYCPADFIFRSKSIGSWAKIHVHLYSKASCKLSFLLFYAFLE